MKKLNNAELGALAQKIQSEVIKNKKTLGENIKVKVQERINKTWSKFVNSNDYKVLLKYKITPKLGMVLNLPLKEGGFTFDTNYGYGAGTSYDNKLETDGGTLYFGCKDSSVSYDDIKRELILGQIDAENLDSLIDKVKKSLKIQ